jgi:hypothetical protein
VGGLFEPPMSLRTLHPLILGGLKSHLVHIRKGFPSLTLPSSPHGQICRLDA